MTLGIKKEKLSASKASQSVQGELRKYQLYWRKAKNGRNPEIIRLAAEQFKKLGVSSGFNFEGSRLELL